MLLSETRKLLQQSRKIVDEADENTSVNIILNMILKLVSSIDTRLQGVEKSVGKFEELKNIITSVTSRVVTRDGGVGNFFDNLKSLCDTNKSTVAKVQDQYEVVKTACNKNKAEIKKVSESLEKVTNRESNQCVCLEEVQNLKKSVLDLKCRSMKNNLIFSGLCEIREENTEELLRTFLHREIGIDYRIEFGNVHRFSNYPRGKRPIVARFLYFSDLQYVLNNAYKLRNTQYGIRQQFPKEIEDNRKLLYAIQKEAKRQGKRVVLVRDRLYIDNQLYTRPNSEADESYMNDTEQPPDDVWTTPTNGGSRQPPKRQRVSSSTPRGY
ncbi:unnamed protein product [Mytilus coruscus]|uniref:Uncharacterized protein n=1 Tax=Mytilus coruscus TaxID=42192 RepID=A0A6J8AHB3_MYTCO|nr:unnamed protein product [Mytilus coruscus]